MGAGTGGIFRFGSLYRDVVGMHKGVAYPYLDDRWAVSAWFFRGFVPRKMRLTFFPVQPSYWSPLDGYVGVSDVGVVLADREQVEWDMPLAAGITYFQVILSVAYPPEGKSGSWGIAVDGPSFPTLAGAFRLFPAPVYDTVNNVWPFGPSVGGDPYTSPNTIAEFARWADV